MENLGDNDLIEQYLDGSLPAAERQAVETRMTKDATFRADVELHRQLHAEFADPQKLRLRTMLSDIVQQPPAANYGWLKGLGLALLILLALWLGWRWYATSQVGSAIPVGPPQIQSPKTPVEKIDSLQQAPVQATEKEPSPIAMADPADFAVNREFEDRLGSTVRSTDGAAEVQLPRMGANFTPLNGLVKINFQGTAPAGTDDASQPLIIKVYTNQVGASQPQLRILPTISNRNKGAEPWKFSASQRLRLRPGLYYFTLERQAEEELIYVGKFTVGKH